MAIEVYPAATLVAHGIRSDGYKEPKDMPERREIICGLERKMLLAVDVPVLEAKADALDAVVCLLAAQDFLTGNAVSPPHADLAQREGWIWTPARRLLRV